MTELKSKSSSNNGNTATSEMRTITVVSTRGEKKKIAYDGGEWAGLRDRLEEEGYELENMKCVEGVRKSTLEHDKAILPPGNFHLFLMPYKSKLGAMTRAEIMSAIKGHVNADGEVAKAHFAQHGNYTQVSSSKLEELLESYKPGSKKEAKKKKATAIADVVESVKASKKETDGSNIDLYDEVSRLSTDDKLFLIISILGEIREGLSGGATAMVANPVAKSQEEIDAENKQKEEQQEEMRKREEKEKRRKEKLEQKQKELDQEDEELNSEMGDLMSGFNDIDKNKMSKVRSKVSEDDLDDNEEDD